MKPKLVMVKGPTKLDARREKLRDERWPEAKQLIWDRKAEDGFVTIPRTLPLIATLIKHLSSKSGDASRVYLDLWARSYDQGLVEISDEREVALCAGIADNTRTVPAWQERMSELVGLGFILIAPSASRKNGFVLLLHPYAVVELINAQDANKIPRWWWELYRDRLDKIGAKIPDAKQFDEFLTNARARMAS